MNQLPDQLSLNIKLDDSVSLDKFIKCKSNSNSLEFLRSTVLDTSVSNLFFIWGLEGVGKSYIMQALNKEFINLNKKTLHLSLDDSRITSHEIFQNLGSLDVLLIEKIDRLPQDQDWELYTQNQFSEIIISKTLKVIPPWTPKKKFDGINNLYLAPGFINCKASTQPGITPFTGNVAG